MLETDLYRILQICYVNKLFRLYFQILICDVINEITQSRWKSPTPAQAPVPTATVTATIPSVEPVTSVIEDEIVNDIAPAAYLLLFLLNLYLCCCCCCSYSSSFLNMFRNAFIF